MNRQYPSLEAKSILVTGAAQGIGRAISELALSLGATVTAIDLNREALEAFRAEVGADRLLPMSGDVADPSFAQSTVDAAAAKFGALHGLVNNAGFTRPSMIEKMTVEQWQQVLGVHLSGSFYFLQAIGRHMLGRIRTGDTAPGSIVNISSDAGRAGTVGQANYGAAKAGVFGLTMCAAREWAKYNVRVNTVGFGVVETSMTETIRSERFAETYLSRIPLGRWAEAQEVAQPICFLLSDAASYITGQHISANGGYTIGL